MRAANRKQIFNEINITPLTDIFLVLLIIMMVVAPMLDTKGLKLPVPTVGPSAEVKETPKTIELLIDASGAYSIDGKNISPNWLVNELRSLKADKPDGIIIKTNPEARHEALTRAMDEAQSAAIKSIAVVMDEAHASPTGQ